MGSNRNFFKLKTSQAEDSVYLYDCEKKDLYSEILENFNKNDCVFNRNLMAYLEAPDHFGDSFYRKHIPSCPSCLAVAQEYKNIQNKITQAIPNQQMSDELLSMIKNDIKEAQNLFNRDPNAIKKINMLATFRMSLTEFFVGFFTSREIIFGLLLACLFALGAFLIN